MNMSTLWKIQLGLGTALAAALAFTAGCASTVADDEPLGEAEEAIVTTVPAGTRLSCSMSSPTGTGRRQATLLVGSDYSTCYREAVPGDIPASSYVRSCHEVGRSIGCDYIQTLY